MPKLQEQYIERRKLVEQSKGLIDAAEKESRGLNSEEQDKFDKIFADIERLHKDIENGEKQLQIERSIADEVAKDEEIQDKIKGGKGTDKEKRAAILQDAARSYIMTGEIPKECYTEWRALQSGSDTKGGYLVLPEQFVNQLIKFVDDILVVRQLATVFKVPKADSLGAPSLDTDPDDANWTTELQTGSEDSNMAFGKRELHPHPFAKRIKISEQLIQQSVMNVESIVVQRLGYKFNLTEEKGYLTGNGSQQPLGLFTADAQGISTGRDVSTDNTTTSITFDGLMNAKYNLKSQYQTAASTRWLFHRDAVKQIAKLKDGEGQYIWQPSVTVGSPDVILGVGVVQSENAPSTFTTGLYVGLIWDMSFYWIADALDMKIKRLVELYAETDQVGLIGRKASDGMPVLEEAFTRVTLA